MRTLFRFLTVSLVAVACNETFGLDPGKPRPPEGEGGTAGSPSAGGSAPISGSSNGGSRSGAAGSDGESGKAGEQSGGAGGTNAGRGGGDEGGSGGSADAGAGAGAGGESCSSHECRDQGGTGLCVNGTCQDITTDGCSIVLGDEWIENGPEAEPFFFGAYVSLNPETLQESPIYWNLKLAMKEFSEYGPIPIDGTLRRPVLLLCHRLPGDTTVGIVEGLNHLIENLGVSGMLMITSRPELQFAVESTLTGVAPKDVFFIDAFGAHDRVLGYDDPFSSPDRLWHMLGDDGLIRLSFVPLVERVEEHVNPGASSRQSARPTRLALITTVSDDGFENRVAEGLSLWLRINGAPVSAQSADFKKVDGFNTLDVIASEVAAFEPDIVVNFRGRDELEPLIDEAMPSGSTRLPFYVLPPMRARSATLKATVAANPTLRTRIVGMADAAAEDTTLYDAYLERLERLAPDDVDVRGTENLYDPVYFLLYSAVAGGSGGTPMALGMKRLVADAPRRDIGPAHIGSVIERLLESDTTRLSFYGTLGKPDFHTTGGRYAYANAWCLDDALEYRMDVLRYDYDSDSLSGTFPCFEF